MVGCHPPPADSHARDQPLAARWRLRSSALRMAARDRERESLSSNSPAVICTFRTFLIDDDRSNAFLWNERERKKKETPHLNKYISFYYSYQCAKRILNVADEGGVLSDGRCRWMKFISFDLQLN